MVQIQDIWKQNQKLPQISELGPLAFVPHLSLQCFPGAQIGSQCGTTKHSGLLPGDLRNETSCCFDLQKDPRIFIISGVLSKGTEQWSLNLNSLFFQNYYMYYRSDIWIAKLMSLYLRAQAPESNSSLKSYATDYFSVNWNFFSDF